MKKWGIWLKRTAWVAMGLVLMSGSAGISVMASDISETGTSGESTKITVMSFEKLPQEESVQHVEPGCTEEEALSQLPTELDAFVVVRTSQNNIQSNTAEVQESTADGAINTENEDTSGQTLETNNIANNTSVLSSGKKFLETGENQALPQVPMKVPVSWELDVDNDYSTSGTFNSVEGARFQYTPVVMATDRNGNQFEADATLYSKELPSMHVLAVNQTGGNDMISNEATPTAGGDNDFKPNEDYKQDSTHGITVYAETQAGKNNITFETDNNFRIKGGGTFGVGGTWSRIQAADGTFIPSSDTPVITIEGPGTFTLVLLEGLSLDTTTNNSAKPLIKVEGNANVILRSSGGVMNCEEDGEAEHAALWVTSGSTVEISGKAKNGFSIEGRVRNDGTLIVTKNAADDGSNGLTVNGMVVNAGEMLIGKYDESDVSADGSAGVWKYGYLDISGDSGVFSNLPNAKLTVGNGSILKVSGNPSTGNGFENAGTLNVGEKGEISVDNSRFTNKGELSIKRDGKLTSMTLSNDKNLVVETGGTLTVKSDLTNEGTGTLRVKSWTIPKPTTGNTDDGGKLIVGNNAAEVVNKGIIELEEGGRFSTNSASGITVKNSGSFGIAEKGCLESSSIRLEKIEDGDTENEEGEKKGGKFYLRGLSDDLIKHIDDLSYTGDNQYQDVRTEWGFEPAWTYANGNVEFEVVPSDWIPSFYRSDDEDGNSGFVEAGTDVTLPGWYWVVYTARADRWRNNTARNNFYMKPASLTVSCIDTSSVSLDHPDLVANYPDEDKRKDAIAYELGADVKIRVKLAIASKRDKNEGVKDSLNIKVYTIKNGSEEYLKDLTGKELKPDAYQVEFDSKGCATISIKDIPTISTDGLVSPAIYKIEAHYKETGSSLEPDEQKIVETDGDTKEFIIVRGQTIIDLSSYGFSYTYGDVIKNPELNKTVFVDSPAISQKLKYEWFLADSVEDVKENKNTVQSLGGEFPTKEEMEKKFGSNWNGIIVGDYVLRASMDETALTTKGEAYQKITLNPKEITVTIPNEPHKTYGTSDADTPIEYQVTGLVKWPLEPKEGEEQKEDELVGTLTRDRDKTNGGSDEYDSVGSYIIRKGTLNETKNPNYKITLNGNYSYTIDPKTLNWGMSNLIVAQQDNRYKVYGGLTLSNVMEEDKDRVGVTYERLSVNEDGTILEVVEPKIININDAVDKNYALNYNPPASNEIPINDSIYRLKVTEGSIEHLSDAMKTQGKTTIGIEGEMATAIKALRAEELAYKSDEYYKIYDVIVTKEGDPVEDIFQKGGLIVTIPYPEGTSSATNFVAAHMITSDIKGAKAPGTIERFAGSDDRGELYKLERTPDGITIKVTGLSPVAIAWAPAGTTPIDPDNPNNGNNGGNNNGGTNGDNNNNGTNSGNNGTNGGNNGTNSGNNNGTNSGTNGTNNGTNSGTNGTNNGTNGTNNGTNGTDNKSNSTTNNTNKTGTSSTTKTTGVKTGDPAEIAFYSIATLIACLLLIVIILLIRAQLRKRE